MNPTRPQLYDKILEMLATPMVSRDIAEELHISPSYARKLVSDMRKRKLIHIASYMREELNGKLYPRAVYAVGHRRDARKPPPLTRKDYTDRYRARKRGAVPSVFTLATPVDIRRTGDTWKKVKATRSKTFSTSEGPGTEPSPTTPTQRSV